MITLFNEYAIGAKRLSDAELNRESSPSGQTHIGLSEKVFTFLPNTPKEMEGILIFNKSCSVVECAFSKIGNKRSTKIDSQTSNPIKSIVRQIRNIAADETHNWYLIWFALENQTPIFWLFNNMSEEYNELCNVIELETALKVYKATDDAFFKILAIVRSFPKFTSMVETKYDFTKGNRLIAMSKEHRTFVHLCLDYFRAQNSLDKMVPYFNTTEQDAPIKVSSINGNFQLTNMFMFSDIDEITRRNSTKQGRRWYTDKFIVKNRELYLYVDWYPGKNKDGKDEQLMIPDFNRFIATCFGEKYVYRNAQGVHQMWLINDPENINSDTEDRFCETPYEQKDALAFLDSTFSPSQIIYYGAPGTGKSHTIKEKEDNGLHCIRTTFHPDSDYATFVGCYKPHRNRETKELTYEFVEQAFLEAYRWAWTHPEEESALVIEEINRGNCAQIFGDIFQLLDRDEDGWSTYPIKADTDISDHLEDLAISGYGEMMARRYGEDKAGYGYLALPPNMSILATMNTSDQSLFPIDSAFKRRWDWEYIPIAQGKDEDDNDLDWRIETTAENDSWWDFVRSINTVIAGTTHSEDKELGFFFTKADKNGRISKERFVGKVVFYLWNDVFKTYGFRSDIFDKDSEGTKKLKFHDFYLRDGKVNEATVALFINNVMKHLPKEKNSEGSKENSIAETDA